MRTFWASCLFVLCCRFYFDTLDLYTQSLKIFLVCSPFRNTRLTQLLVATSSVQRCLSVASTAIYTEQASCLIFHGNVTYFALRDDSLNSSRHQVCFPQLVLTVTHRWGIHDVRKLNSLVLKPAALSDNSVNETCTYISMAT